MKNLVSSASFGSERCEVNISKIFHFVIKSFLVVSLKSFSVFLILKLTATKYLFTFGGDCHLSY